MASSRQPADTKDTAKEETSPSFSAEDAFHPGPLVDALPGPVQIVDAAGVLRYANNALHDMLGYEPGTLTGTPLPRLQPDTLEDELQAYLRKVVDGADTGAEILVQYRMRSGKPLEAQVASRAIRVDGAAYVLSSVHPVKGDARPGAFAHRQWQLQLFSNLSSDYFYRTTLDDTKIPVEIWPLGRFTAITGYTRDAVIEAGGWPRLIHPDDLADISPPARLRPEDGPRQSEYRIIAASGETRWLRDTHQVVEEPETGTLLLFGAVLDITEQRVTHEALRESEAQLRRIFETVSQSFALLDSELRVVAANKKMFYDFERGYKKTLELGRSFPEQLPPDWRRVFDENARAALQGEHRREELLWRLPSGEEEWAAVQLNPIVENGETVGISLCVEGVHRRKVAELALRDSERQLRGIFDTVSQGFILLDTDLRVQAANQRMFDEFPRVFGVPLTIGEPLTDILPDDLQAELVENVAAVLQGERRTQEILFPLAEGGEEWGEIQLNPIVEDGAVVGISLCSDEIHRRKVAELALRESETRLRRIFETVSQGFAMLDRDLRVELANQQMLHEYEAVFGQELVIGQAFDTLLPESWRAGFREDAQAALAGEYRYREIYYPDSGTSAKWFELEMNPIVEDGEVVGINLCADEIDLRKEAEQALQQSHDALEEKVAERTRELQTAYDQLRESEERLRLIAERASDVIWHIDGQNTILFMSPSFERVFGWPVETIKTQGIDIAFRPEKRAELTEAMDAHLQYWRRRGEHPPTFTYEVEYKHRDGTPFFAEANMDFDFPNFERWLAEGREEDYPHILGVSRDLTERKRQEAERRELEQQVLHAQKLESLGVMAGGIAHDFNNLLVGIMGYASLTTMELPEEHPVQSYVKQIEAASQRAADLTQQMLAYSGRGQFVVQPVCLSHLAREMAHLLATVVSKKAVIEYDLAEELPTVRCDATQLRQVIMNLITNASEALEENAGIIRLSTGACKLSAADLRALMAAENAKPGAFVYLEVADTGCGMDQATFERIFEPFYSTKFTGRGLGLGAVHGIVRGHHGAIRVVSAIGEGTRVRIFLPVSNEPLPEEAPSDAGEEAPRPAQGERILVVDDEDSVRNFARHALELGGYEVVEARNGREALDTLEREDGLHAILLDLTMPEMDGAETLAVLRERWPELPVVLSSGHAEQQVLEDIGPGTPFLHKPYHPDLLRQLVRQAIAPHEG